MRKRRIVIIILGALMFMAAITYVVHSCSVKKGKEKFAKANAQMSEILSENNDLREQNKILKNEVVKLRAEVENLKVEIKRLRDLVEKERREQEIGRKSLAGLKQWATKNGKVETHKEVIRAYGGRIILAASKHGVNYRIIAAIITVESDGKVKAVSSSKAYGLMGLKRITAHLVGVRDVFHPYENIFGGTKYFKTLLERFGDYKTALAAYNEGPTKVALWLKKGFDPNGHTYVQRVLFLASI